MANFLAGDFLGAMVRKNPPGRARPLVLLCHGQGTFQTRSLLTYEHLPEFDFITPDCHLLGKNALMILFTLMRDAVYGIRAHF